MSSLVIDGREHLCIKIWKTIWNEWLCCIIDVVTLMWFIERKVTNYIGEVLLQ